MFFNPKTKLQNNAAKHIAIEGAHTQRVVEQIDLLKDFLEKNNTTPELIEYPLFSGNVATYANSHAPGKGNEYLTGLFLALDQMDNAPELKRTIRSGKHIISTGGFVHSFLHLASTLESQEQHLPFLKWLEHIHYTVCKVPRPDLTLIITNPKEGSHNLLVQCSRLLPNTKLIHEVGAIETHNIIWELVRRIALKPQQTTQS